LLGLGRDSGWDDVTGAAAKAGALRRPAAAAIHAAEAIIRAPAIACQGPLSGMPPITNSTIEIAKPIPSARGSDPDRATATPATTTLTISSSSPVTAVTFIHCPFTTVWISRSACAVWPAR
jgi:hypothetical protein